MSQQRKQQQSHNLPKPTREGDGWNQIPLLIAQGHLYYQLSVERLKGQAVNG
jgi:hypothetical protein